MLEAQRGPGRSYGLAHVVLGAALLAATAGAGSPQTPPPSTGGDSGARIDALLRRYNELGQFNGTALVMRQGAALVDAGYGLASFEMNVPNGAETRHWIGSVSKVFTATTVMRLVDQKKLSLDGKVADVLPWYRKDTGAKVTIRQLLNHTSGIPDYMHLPGIGPERFARQVGDDVIDVRAFVEKWCSGDLQFEPGMQWAYSNSGYAILGAIVEQVIGQPFDRALHVLVLDPLGLKETGDLAMRPRSVVEGLTPGYEKPLGELATRRHWNISTAYAAGAMYSTVGDLYRFSQAFDRDDFLSARAREAMFTEGLGHYGCGWEVKSMPIGPGKAIRKVQGHEGFIFWSLARVYRIPEDAVFIALVNNTGDAPLPAIFAGITDILYGRAPALPKPSAADAVRSLAIYESGLAAVKKYRSLKESSPDDYEFDERGLNTLGYALLQERRPEAAVAIFRLGVESYPNSANAYDSLGEGLAAAGQTEEAIKAYARSLLLDPANANAVERLGKLVAKH